MKYSSISLVCALAIAALGTVDPARASVRSGASPSAVVSSFYNLYLQKLDWFVADGSNHRWTRLTSPQLAALIKAQSQRYQRWQSLNPGMKGPFSEDPFTCNHYESPSSLHVGQPRFAAAVARVTVTFQYLDPPWPAIECSVDVILARYKSGWKIENIEFDRGPDLVSNLSHVDDPT